MSDDVVVALPGYRVPDPQACAKNVVAILEKALAEARSGNLRSVGLVKVIEDGTPQPILGTEFEWSPGRLGELLNAAGVLVRRIERTYDE
jgi:hypothetical protein